jgi:hypothetical protein
VTYVCIGYLTSKEYELSTGLLVNALIGFYDGTIGFKLSIILKANTGLNKEKSLEHLNGKTAFFMITIAIVFALIGYAISKA